MVDEMFAEMSEDAINAKVERPIDEIRARFVLEGSTARDSTECLGIVGRLVQEAYFQAITPGGRPPMPKAIGIGKDHLSQQGRRHGKTVNSYILDCVHGYDGAMNAALEAICEGLKSEGVRHLLDDICDRFIPPDDFGAKVRAVREVISKFAFCLPAEVRKAPPEQYATQYREVFQFVYQTMREAGRSYRRL